MLLLGSCHKSHRRLLAPICGAARSIETRGSSVAKAAILSVWACASDNPQQTGVSCSRHRYALEMASYESELKRCYDHAELMWRTPGGLRMLIAPSWNTTNIARKSANCVGSLARQPPQELQGYISSGHLMSLSSARSMVASSSLIDSKSNLVSACVLSSSP